MDIPRRKYIGERFSPPNVNDQALDRSPVGLIARCRNRGTKRQGETFSKAGIHRHLAGVLVMFKGMRKVAFAIAATAIVVIPTSAFFPIF
jgi:hypothetical protein